MTLTALSDDISHSPKRGFSCTDCSYQTAGTAAFPDLEKLPLFVALPLCDYLTENQPVLKLWNACYSVELLLRLFVAIFYTLEKLIRLLYK
jgi:uncharacterized MAPEG superfamily protein